MKVRVLTANGAMDTVTVTDALFGLKANPALLAQAIRVYLSNLRQGTSKAKTRGEVNRTKRKWYKQKGTGNARHGARSANIFVGGGAGHGPTGLENWTRALNTTMKRQALKLALSAQVEQIMIAEDVTKLSGKTKDGQALMSQIAPKGQKVLVVLAERNDAAERSLRNIEEVLLITARQLTALEVSTADTIVLNGDSIEALEARLAPTAGLVTIPKEEKKPVAKKTTAAKPAAKKAAAAKTTKTTAKTKKTTTK